MKPFYITTTLPYINSRPHIGFAAEIIRADVLARYHRLLGEEVFFNTGSDEHGLKIYRKAEEEGIAPQEYCDRLAKDFQNLKPLLNLSYDSFIRTTEERHLQSAQAFWELCQASGDIYKKKYSVKYCVGCELEKTDSELVGGRCPLHPDRDLEIIKEENYFFRFSKYQDQLLKLYDSHPDFVYPAHRLKEIRNFVASGLQDFSISRLKEKMPWGVPVPGDEKQIMYVWFDALVNYISCLDWPQDKKNLKKYWPGLQVCGKDNLRQQTAMWQAMLMSAGLPNSQQVLIFGFINSDGQKMSKSLSNVVEPQYLVDKYGVDATRHYLLKELPTFEDGDYTETKFVALYNSDLANGLGNLVSRSANLIEKNELQLSLKPNSDPKLAKEIGKTMAEYNFNGALKALWDKIKESDEYLSLKAPWKMTDKEEIKAVLEIVAQNILNISYWLEPFLPETAGKISAQFQASQIKKGEGLFPRLNNLS
ncbi:MAG TPA: methionine--tRNA ligase [bacterium]|nr:methionine--tRNA ligase [bacterium]HPT30042.1 methionine--tRNA ligase [bacterium]